MTKYALIKDGVFLQSRDFGSDTPPVLHPDKGRWVQFIVGTQPSYNHATEKIIKSRVVNVDNVTDSWAVAQFTAAELTDINNAKGADADSTLASPLNKTIFEALWSLRQAAGAAGQLPVITKAQYRDQLKTLLLGFQ